MLKICLLTIYESLVLFFIPSSRDAKRMETGELLKVANPLLAAMVGVIDSQLSCLHRMFPQGWRRLELSFALIMASWVDHYTVNSSSWCRADARAVLFLAWLKHFSRTKGPRAHLLFSAGPRGLVLPLKRDFYIYARGQKLCFLLSSFDLY